MSNSRQRTLYRSSYTIANANRFRSIFDRFIDFNEGKIIDDAKDITIGPLKNISSFSLRQKMSDALLFLANEEPDQAHRELYNKLKVSTAFSIHLESKAVVFYFKDNRQHFNRKTVTREDLEASIKTIGDKPLTDYSGGLQKRIVDFLSGDKHILVIKNLNLSNEEQDLIYILLKDTNIERLISKTEIRLLK